MASIIHSIYDSVDIWSDTLKLIQGKHGSCVATYFLLTKSLLIFYLIPAVLSICFLYIPLIHNRQISLNSSHNSSNNAIFQPSDIFTGEGWIGESALFYGAYPDSDELGGYSIQLAYGLIIIIVFIVCGCRTFLLGQRYFSRAIHFQMLSHSGFSKMLLAGWDYSIIDSHMAQLQKRANVARIREKLNSQAITHRGPVYYFKAISIWIICLLLTAVSSYFIIWLGETNYESYVFICMKYTVFGCQKQNRIAILLPLISSIIATLLSRFFTMLSKWERHLSIQSSILITIFRSLLAKVTLMACVIYEFTTRIPCEKTSTPPCIVDDNTCWENQLGYEFYKLFIFDSLVSLVLNSLLFEFLFSACAKACRFKPPSFDIPTNSVDAVFGSAIALIAFYFSPLLCVLACFRLVVMFYVKWISVAFICDVPKFVINLGSISMTQIIGQSISYFFALLFLITFVLPSKTSNVCGPFQNVEYAVDVIRKSAVGFLRIVIEKVTDICTSSMFLFFLMFSLIGLVLIIRTRIRGQNQEVKRLKNMMVKRGYKTMMRL